MDRDSGHWTGVNQLDSLLYLRTSFARSVSWSSLHCSSCRDIRCDQIDPSSWFSQRIAGSRCSWRIDLLGGKGRSVDDIVYTQNHPDDLSSEEELLTLGDKGVVYELLLHV